MRVSATDTTLTGGAPGIMAYGTPQGDNWVGVGATGTTGTYSVGGTVSGLSGTVVLQDNGGDDLSVSANGTFTFATALAQNAAYNVTVKTNPSGQLCAVSNPSGTVGTANVTNVAVTCSASATALGHRHLQPGRRKPRPGLDHHERRRTGDLLPGGDRHQGGVLG